MNRCISTCVCVTNLHSTINTGYACPWVHMYCVTVDKLTPWMFDQFLLWHKLHVRSMFSDNSNYLYGRCICKDKFPLFNEKNSIIKWKIHVLPLNESLKKDKGRLVSTLWWGNINLNILVHKLLAVIMLKCIGEGNEAVYV